MATCNFAEIKNKIGFKAAEPYMQAILYHYHSTKNKALENPMFNFPCFILTIFSEWLVPMSLLIADHGAKGMHIGFSGAIWSTWLNYQVLSTVLPLFWHKTDPQMQMIAAHHFSALKKSLHSLHECYQSFHSSLTNPFIDYPDPQYPHHHQYTSLKDWTEHRVQYLSHMTLSKLLFDAQDANKQVCIKFVCSYSMGAHQWCSKMEFAVQLRGFKHLPGGWFMVIMDKLGD